MQHARVMRCDAVYFGINAQFWLQSSTLKMEAARPPDVAYICQHTMSHISELHDIHEHCCGVQNLAVCLRTFLPYVMAMSLKIPRPVRCLVK
jgi:hypothetical protein